MSAAQDCPASCYDLPRKDLQRMLTPTLVVFLDHVEANIRRALQYTGGQAERWRPHVKTTKIPQVWARLAAYGIRHFKCATTREAEVLLATLGGISRPDTDLLVAYPHVEPALTRLAQLARAHPAARLSVLCEEPEAVGQIPAELSIFVDVNPGMNRTGVALADPARILGLARRAGKRFRGIHFYEGHITQGTYAERSQRAFAVYDRLMELVSVMRREGLPLEEIVTSGTPTFMPALAYQPFAELRATSHRVSPGTVVFHDARSAEDAPELELTPAAVVLSRVISHPAEDLVTCDAGSKSIAAEAGDPCAVVAGHAEWVAQKPSEEHLPLRVTKGPQPSRGTPLWLIPRHVCPTVNLAETAVLVENGRIVELASVSARAHETMLISTR